jgi:hypothetical protein
VIGIKRKISIKLVVTVGLGFSLLVSAIVLWAGTNELWILLGGALYAILQAAVVYFFWPR